MSRSQQSVRYNVIISLGNLEEVYRLSTLDYSFEDNNIIPASDEENVPQDKIFVNMHNA